MKIINILTLFLTISLYAQTRQELQAEKEKLLLEQKSHQVALLKHQVELDQLNAKVAVEETKLKNLETFLANKISFKDQAIQQIDNELENLPRLSKKTSFMKCLKANLKNKGWADVAECEYYHTVTLTEDQQQMIQSWNFGLSLNPQEIDQKKIDLQGDITFDKSKARISAAKVASSTVKSNEVITKLEKLKEKEKTRDLLDKNIKYTQCNQDTPVVDLEEQVPFPSASFKGPFYGVPRDNQDGIGSCFANTAKNLLVGASNGKEIASFLDLALLYKGSGVVNDGLDGGDACLVIQQLQNAGYCPQKYAPVEQGEKNIYTQSLIGENATIYTQADLIDSFKVFLSAQENFKKSDKLLSEKFLENAKKLIQQIKDNPTVQIPIPLAKKPIPPYWTLINVSNSEKVTKHPSFKSQQTFLYDYKNEYRKFYAHFISEIAKGKNRDELFDLFLKDMKPFLDKYGLNDKALEWKKLFLMDTEYDWNSKTLKDDIAASMSFLKKISQKESLSDAEFIKTCDQSSIDLLQFLDKLTPLIKHLERNKLDPSLLTNKTGQFKPGTELMQLIVAPECLKPENRIKPKDKISCDRDGVFLQKIKASGKSQDEQRMMFREKILGNLLQGYAVGNTFQRHINTIVGLRFNKEKNRCEFKTRESQTGTSFWEDEDEIFKKMETITEVRRK